MRFALWSLDLAIRDFASFKHCFIKKSIVLSYFRDSGKRIFYDYKTFKQTTGTIIALVYVGSIVI